MPIPLPPGSYEARVWFAGGLAREGEIVVSSAEGARFGRIEGALPNPATVRFDLPVGEGRLSVNVPSPALMASVIRIEIEPRSVVPRTARASVSARAIESIEDWPGGYLVYTDEEAYPEGGVFWTRGTETAHVLVAPAGASRIVLTLHLGPLAGVVRLSLAGKEYAPTVASNDLTKFEVDVPPNLRLVPMTFQCTDSFRPSEVDPSSDDVRRLGCQVRVELR